MLRLSFSVKKLSNAGDCDDKQRLLEHAGGKTRQVAAVVCRAADRSPIHLFSLESEMKSSFRKNRLGICERKRKLVLGEQV